MKKEMAKLGSVFLMFVLIISLFPFGVIAQDELGESHVNVPVVEGECPSDCWLNNMGGCTCPKEDGPKDDYAGNYEPPEEDHRGPIEDYKKDYYEKFEEYDGPKEFDVNPGTTPDSVFYFVDDLFERPGDNPEKALDYKEEKIAEAIIMVDKGMPVEAKEVLEKAEEYNKIIEEEVTPELEERIEESSMQIQTVLLEIEEDLEGEAEWEGVMEKVDDTFEKEGKVRTAAEIAAKINELCAELAQLDPIQYEDTCKTDADAPKWMKDKHVEWSREQEQEAREFGKILGECFATSGRECRCGEIAFYDFQVFCEKMFDLVVGCDGGDENACVAMDSEEMPELPEHLEEVFDEIEEEFAEEKYGNEKFKPKECEGLEQKECMLVMVELKVPPECRGAIKEAIESGAIRGERGARDICDKIMFEKHTPKECIDAGARTPEECARHMMPDQCIEAGMTGEHRSDEMKCKELMKKGRHYGGGACTGEGSVEERLTCLEGAVRVMDDMYYRPEAMPEERGEMTWQCKENRIHWPPDCEKFMREVWPGMEKQQSREWERDRMEREEYHKYRVEPGRQLCPDGICDDWERNSGGCWEDCGDVSPGSGAGGMDCGPGCYFDFYYNSCECPIMINCGPGCWPEGDRCECSTYGGIDCGHGCWWENDHCECGGCTCGDGRWSENCMCGPEVNQGCWCGSMWSDTCDCGTTPGMVGCQCSWGWSPDCNCGTSSGTACSPGCWWEMDHCECGDRVACSPGCWWDDYYKSCQCSYTDTCPSNSYTTSHGACDYSVCPGGCNFDYTGCPKGCMSSGGCECGMGCYSPICNCEVDCSQVVNTICGDGICEGNEYCPMDCETSGGCQCSWGWSHDCMCGASSGCQCYDQCSSPTYWDDYCNCPTSPACGSYIRCYGDSECGSGEVCMNPGTSSSWCDYTGGTSGVGCESYTSESACYADSNCGVWCLGEGPYGNDCYTSGYVCGSYTSNTYCGDGMCSGGETMSSCPSDCGTSGGDMTCNTWVSGAGTYCDPVSGICCSDGYCSNMNGPGVCESSDGGSYACSSDSDCGSGEVCMSLGTTSSWCDAISGSGTSGCSCADGYWSDTCDCSGHESAGCECGGSCGWSDTCDCSGCYEEPEDVCAGCDCNGMPCGTECAGTDRNICCYADPCEEAPITGGVIFWDYYYS